MFEPVKGVATGRGQEHFILEVGQIQDRGCRHVRSVGRGQIGVLLQGEIHRGNAPGQEGLAVGRLEA